MMSVRQVSNSLRCLIYLSFLCIHFSENKGHLTFLLVVVCLTRPMEGMGRLQFSDHFTELTVPTQASVVVKTIL